MEVLQAVTDAWQHRRDDVTGQAREITDVVARVTAAPPASTDALPRSHGGPHGGPDAAVLPDAVRKVLSRADREWGGFGRAPKFPNTMTLDLMTAVAATRDGPLAHDACNHLALTLDRMDRGGIHDHLGGGFARYSTDARWLVPHFEKMLYDNAQLARSYLDAWRLLSHGETADMTAPRCRAVVTDVVTYLLREMTARDGTFFSAQDADSEGEEGRYFVWTPAEIEAVVGPADAPAVCAWFDVTEEGNFEHGRSILWTPRGVSEVADAIGLDPQVVQAAIARTRQGLFAARSRRVAPARDDKSLAAWNALVIGALADAGATLCEPSWVTAAQQSLATWRTLAWRDGRLCHAIKSGEAYGTGFLDDYAGLAGAAMDVYEATFDPDALAFARSLGDAVLELFHDRETGEFCYTPVDGEVVLVRTRDPHDHAYPGGVGLALDALLRLSSLTGDGRYRAAAEGALAVFAPLARDNPMGVATVVRAVDRAARGSVDVVVAGDPAREDTRALLTAARSVCLPHRTLSCARDPDEARTQGLDGERFNGRPSGANGAPRAYVCRGTACELPVETAEALVATLLRAAQAG